MHLRAGILTAICLAVAVPAVAGQGPSAQPSGQTAAAAPPAPAVEVSRLPINVNRIGRQLRQAEVREERDGLRLRYTLNVFGERPRIQLITPLDNLLTGDVPHSSPTHADMLRMMTPQEFRGGAVIFGSIPRK